MTNNEIALDFAREVMGWENAELPAREWLDDNESSLPICSDKEQEGFHGDDIDKVLQEVRKWCLEYDHFLNIKFTDIQNCNAVTGGYLIHGQYVVDIAKGRYLVGQGGCENLSIALMTACLEAERKRRGE